MFSRVSKKAKGDNEHKGKGMKVLRQNPPKSKCFDNCTSLHNPIHTVTHRTQKDIFSHPMYAQNYTEESVSQGMKNLDSENYQASYNTV